MSATAAAAPRAERPAALEVENVVAGIGPLTILQGVSLTVDAGGVTVLLGANGAGKTTLLRTVAGLLAPRSGRILLYGEPIGGRAAHLVARAGIGHVPSGRELFSRMSVSDHIELGARLCEPKRRAELRDRVLTLFPEIAARLRQAAGTLSGGEQMMVAIARALMTDPRVLLIDEPSTGLAPKVVLSIFRTLPQLQSRGMSVLLAEQSLRSGFSVADRAYILRDGRIVMSGTPAELAADAGVVKAYLGG